MEEQTYTGTKTVRAVPMNRGDYNAYRGWEVPADEDPNDEGFLVEYTDGGKANMPDRHGYVSWSPKDVFERAYRPVDPIEHEIQAKGLNAPRVTPSDLGDNIASEHFFTAYGGAKYGRITRDEPQDSESLKLLTICVLVLSNGFTVVGTSACASPENFNAETGRKIARENAVREIWPLLGFVLKERLHSEPKDWRERLIAEKAELDGRIQKLHRFLENPDSPPHTVGQHAEMERQLAAMNEYADSLAARISGLTTTGV